MRPCAQGAYTQESINHGPLKKGCARTVLNARRVAARAKLWLQEQNCALRPPGRRVAPARPFAGPSDHFKHGVSGVWAVGAPPRPQALRKRYATCRNGTPRRLSQSSTAAGRLTRHACQSELRMKNHESSQDSPCLHDRPAAATDDVTGSPGAT